MKDMKALLVVVVVLLFTATMYSYGTFEREDPHFESKSKDLHTIICGDQKHQKEYVIYIPADENIENFAREYCDTLEEN